MQDRITHQQRAIRDIAERLTTFTSSQRIHDELRNAGKSVGLSTVYRVLHRLAERGELDSVISPSGEVWYRGCRSLGACRHHHLVCIECGHAVDIESSEVNGWIDRIESQYGFTGVLRTVQLTGLCARCACTTPG